MNQSWSQRWAEAQTDEAREKQPSANMKTQMNRQVEGWEQCLRTQIIQHPRIAVGLGLLTGLVAGWWVKR